MTLYLKYRPQQLEELDLGEVRKSLKEIVSSGKIPHAFLFSGPKGTGKTSAARILAKSVNCEKPDKETGEPCNKCEQCLSIAQGDNLDVIELDAASHRGIDDVRALRDAVKLSPAKAERKVYIIDEAHMLTTEASNALLKTLEEPPEHVMFILATTNPEKLINTVRSRATNVKFSRATIEEIVRSLNRVVKGEKLEHEKEALELIAEMSDGSFRDAVKVLEQIVAEGVKVKKKRVKGFLSKRGMFEAEELVKALVERDTQEALELIEDAVSQGASSRSIAESVVKSLREGLMAEMGMNGKRLKGISKQEIISLIKLFIEASGEVSRSFIEQVPLEVAVVEWGEGEIGVNGAGGTDRSGEKKSRNNESISKKKSSKKSSTNGMQEDLPKNGEISEDAWKIVLKKIRPKNASTEALLRAAKPVEYDEGTLTLEVFYSFHKEKLEGNPHRMLIEDTISSIMGENIRIVCILTSPPKKAVAEESEKDSSDEVVLTEEKDEDIVKVAEEIFGA